MIFRGEEAVHGDISRPSVTRTRTVHVSPFDMCKASIIIESSCSGTCTPLTLHSISVATSG